MTQSELDELGLGQSSALGFSLQALVQVRGQLEVAVHFQQRAFHATCTFVYTRIAVSNKNISCVITNAVYTRMNTRRTRMKKIARNFRLNPELNDKLISRSEKTGIPQTTIVEFAIDDYLNDGGILRRLRRNITEFGGDQSAGNTSPMLCSKRRNTARAVLLCPVS